MEIEDEDSPVSHDDAQSKRSSPRSSPRSRASPRSSPRTRGGSPPKVQTRRLSQKEVAEIIAIDTEDRRLSRKRTSTTLRNYNTFREDYAHLRQETLLEQELGTRLHRVADASPSPRHDANGEQKNVMARRGLQRRATPLHVKFDNFAESLFKSNFETPWFLSSCVDRPFYQRLCNPAEFATQRRRDHEERSATGFAASNDGSEKMFGLPLFEKAGFHILPPEEAGLPDDRLHHRLGLHYAVHRKTSVDRLCLKIAKKELPPYIKEEQIHNLVKNLKRCDHVNVLNCKEVCEDEHYLYFFHENFPCVTLLSQLENVTRKCKICTERQAFEEEEIAEKVCQICGERLIEEHVWTHEQVVNIARECYAATAYCNTLSLYHLGWTLCHVLLPVTCLSGDPMVAKIFGFGHMGILHTECQDRTCWSPEAVAEFHRVGEGFAFKMEGSMKTACDSWSLGAITYTLVAKRPPLVGKGKVLDEQIIGQRWVFSPIFDEVDIEAKALVEDFLQGIPEKRIKPGAAIRNEWIRRRWKPPPNGQDVYVKLEEFCRLPLSKRLFGRFLVGFLDAEHMRQIAIKFYSLDAQGDGVISMQDLRVCAKGSERHASSAKLICDWLCPGAENISLSRFAECMAEDIIDGQSLRHAFEGLDENGSEEITPEELLSVLNDLDDSSEITMEQVMEHINEAETMVREKLGEGVAEKGTDHKIDFDEFQGLFPVRVARLLQLQERVKLTRESAHDLAKQFEKVENRAKGWIRDVEGEKEELDKLMTKLADRRVIQETAKDVSRHLRRISDLLRVPPGPNDAKRLTRAYEAAVTASPRKKKGIGTDGLLHFDSFMQDFAIANLWNEFIAEEIKMFKAAVQHSKRDDSVHVDYFKAVDVCKTTVNKLEEVLDFARGQMEEKQLILQIMTDLEAHMPAVTPTCRGLPCHGESERTNDEDDDGNDDGNFFAKFLAKLKFSA